MNLLCHLFPGSIPLLIESVHYIAIFARNDHAFEDVPNDAYFRFLKLQVSNVVLSDFGFSFWLASKRKWCLYIPGLEKGAGQV